MKNTLLLALAVLLSSCATVLSRREYTVSVKSDLPYAKATILDSTYNLPAKFKIERSKKDLAVKLIVDTVTRDYIVKASPTGTFLYCNLSVGLAAPLLYAVDFTNQKRFYYGRIIYLSSLDTVRIIRPTISKQYYNAWTLMRKNWGKLPNYWKNGPKSNKNQINISFGAPWVNYFYSHPQDESSRFNNGFMGVSLGTEYFYKDDRYIAICGNLTKNYVFLLPIPYHYHGIEESITSKHISLTNNIVINRLTFGYGISFAQTTWSQRDYRYLEEYESYQQPVTKTNNTIGFAFDAYFQISRPVFIGVVYRPTFLEVSPDLGINYEHLISLDVRYKLRVKK